MPSERTRSKPGPRASLPSRLTGIVRGHGQGGLGNIPAEEYAGDGTFHDQPRHRSSGDAGREAASARWGLCDARHTHPGTGIPTGDGPDSVTTGGTPIHHRPTSGHVRHVPAQTDCGSSADIDQAQRCSRYPAPSRLSAAHSSARGRTPQRSRGMTLGVAMFFDGMAPCDPTRRWVLHEERKEGWLAHARGFSIRSPRRLSSTKVSGSTHILLTHVYFGSMKGYQDRLPRRRILVQLHAEIKKAGLVLSALRHQPSHDGGFPLCSIRLGLSSSSSFLVSSARIPFRRTSLK